MWPAIGCSAPDTGNVMNAASVNALDATKTLNLYIFCSFRTEQMLLRAITIY